MGTCGRPLCGDSSGGASRRGVRRAWSLAALGLCVVLEMVCVCEAAKGSKVGRPAYLACFGSNPQGRGRVLHRAIASSMPPDVPGSVQGLGRKACPKSYSTGSIGMRMDEAIGVSPTMGSSLRRLSSRSFLRTFTPLTNANGAASATGETYNHGDGDDDTAEARTEFVAECRLPTDKGLFKLLSYRYRGAKLVVRNGERVLEWSEMEPVVVVHGDLKGKKGVVVRVHDQCFTSEVLGSKRCDCKEQLDMALQHIIENEGALIYMPQEGRGIGLANKIAAYELQDDGMDTVDANRHLGFDDDERSYRCVPFILDNMGVESVRLITNNPFKIQELSGLGVRIDSVQPSFVEPNAFNEKYLRTKVERMAHLLSLDRLHAPKKLASALDSAPELVSMAQGEAAAELREGGMVMLTVGSGAEAKGALAILGSKATSEKVAAMCKVSGVPMTAVLPPARWGELALGEGGVLVGSAPPSVDMTDLGSIAMAAGGRASTLQALSDLGVGEGFFSRPGHVFCRNGEEEERAGSVWGRVYALGRLMEGGSGVVGVCEVMSDGGLLAPGMDELEQLAETLRIPMARADED